MLHLTKRQLIRAANPCAAKPHDQRIETALYQIQCNLCRKIRPGLAPRSFQPDNDVQPRKGRKPKVHGINKLITKIELTYPRIAGIQDILVARIQFEDMRVFELIVAKTRYAFQRMRMLNERRQDEGKLPYQIIEINGYERENTLVRKIANMIRQFLSGVQRKLNRVKSRRWQKPETDQADWLKECSRSQLQFGV